MITLKIYKFASDRLPLLWDFSEFLHPADDPMLANDIILDADVSATPSDLTIELVSVIHDGLAIRVMIAGGTTGQEYTLTATIVTAAGVTASSVRTLAVTADAR